MEIKSDQQIRTESYTFPPNEHQRIVVRQDQRQHGEHEQVHVSEVSVERGRSPVLLYEREMGIAGAEPCVEDLLKRMASAMGELRVLPDRAYREQKRNDHCPHAQRVHRRLPYAAAKEEHHRGPEGREERDEINVVQEHVV